MQLHSRVFSGRSCRLLCVAGLLGLLASLTGCGQDEGGDGGKGNNGTSGGLLVGPKPTAAKGSLDKTSAMKNKNEFEKAAQQGNPMFLDAGSLTSSGLQSGTNMALAESAGNLTLLASTVPLAGTGTARSATQLKECTKTEGNPADADKDGWAASIKVTYDCDLSSLGSLGGAEDDEESDLTSPQATSFSFKLQGGTSVKDADDAKAFPKAGFSFAYDNFRMTLSGLGGAMGNDTSTGGAAAGAAAAAGFNIALNGSINVTGDAKELKGVSEFQTSMTAGDKEASRVTQWLSSVSKPDDSADPTKSGSVSFSGFVQFLDDKGAETTLKVSTSGLTYAKSCGTDNGGYKSGTIVYEAASGKVEYVFAECKGTLKFNGEAL